MKELRQCISCEKWGLMDKLTVVSIGSTRIPRYSSIEAHTNHTTAFIHEACLESLSTPT